MSHNAPKTRLRNLRRDIRRELGTSTQPVPSVEQLLESLALLGAALDVASGGAYGAAVYRFSDSSHLPARAVLAHRRKAVEVGRRWREGEITRTEMSEQMDALDRELQGRRDPSAQPRHWQV